MPGPERDSDVTPTASGPMSGSMAPSSDLVTHVDSAGLCASCTTWRWGVNSDALVFAHTFTIRPARQGLACTASMRTATRSSTASSNVLFDGRDGSPTAQQTSRLFVTSLRRQLVVIPRGVWHAERNGTTDVRVVNFPTTPTTTQPRQVPPPDTDQLPVDLGAGWTGW
jgi:dTDP-4-dehydrorhamnose 3,5-epimerase